LAQVTAKHKTLVQHTLKTLVVTLDACTCSNLAQDRHCLWSSKLQRQLWQCGINS